MPTSNSFIGIPTASPIGVVNPEYLMLTLQSASIQLYWPEETVTGQTSVAQLMDISTQGGDVFFPNAKDQSTGYSSVIKNVGGISLNIVQYSSIGTYTQIVTISPGQAVLIYLTDNSTEGGEWDIIYYGVGVINANAASLQGLGLIALSGLLNTTLSSVSSSFATITLTDRAKVLVWTGGTQSCFLPSLSEVSPYGFWFAAANQGTGQLTLFAVGSETINGNSSLVLAPGDSCIISAGALGTTGWFTVGLGQPAGTFQYAILNISSTGGTVTLSSTDAQNTGLLITGALAADLIIEVPSTQNIYFTNNQTSGAYAVKVQTSGGSPLTLVQGQTEIISCDGTTVYNAHSAAGGGGGSGTTGPFAPGAPTSPSINSTVALATGLYWPTTNSIGFSSSGTESLRFSETGITFSTAASSTGTRTSLNVLSADETIALIVALS